jgi:hypothetical protein
MASGKGRAAGKDRYEGGFRDGKTTGYGVYTFASGRRIEGEFVDGKLNGRAKVYNPNGDILAGVFDGVKLIGVGKLTRKTGESFDVELREGKLARATNTSGASAEQAQIERIRAQCIGYGFAPESPDFARCVQTEIQRMQAASDAQQQKSALLAQCKRAMMLRGVGFSAGMMNAAKCDSDPYAHQRDEGRTQRSSSGQGPGTGTYIRSYVSGINRICIYNRVGSEAAITIDASDICHLTIP